MPHQSRVFKLHFLLLSGVCCALFFAGTAQAQSTDPTFPTPVGSREIAGAIPARDIGDSRLTNQYFGFIGAPGDFIVTVQAKNLNGDFDIFTARDLRPLLKITVYAELSSPVTKNIYLRRRENLILRVEGRTPNDDDAVYQLRFSGSFEPIPGGVLLAKSDQPATEGDREPNKVSRKGTRVSSVGARIEEPPTEIAAAPTPEPTPEVIATPQPERSASPEPAKKPPLRNARGRGATVRKTPAQPPSVPKPAKTPAAQDKTSGEAEKEVAKAEGPTTLATSKPAADEKGGKSASGENSGKSASPEKSKPKSETEKKPSTSPRPSDRPVTPPTRTTAPPPDETGARLVIERKDGSRLVYPMTTVTRVTVEKGQILIVKKDGELITVPMSNVARMSIGP